MKSKNLLFSLFVIVSFSSFGQGLWPHENAEWWFELGPWLHNPAIEHRYVDGDTLIEDVNCTRITSDRYWSYNPNSNDLNLHSSSEEIVYFNGDTLFWWKHDAFYPLICFNAQIGEGWYPLPHEESSNCDNNPITVESVETVFYNDEPFRKITLAPYDDFTSTFYWGGSFDERTFWREYSYPENNQCGIAVEWISYSFRCYSDDALSIQESEGPCNAPLSTSPIQEPEFSVYPNPINQGEQLRVDGATITSLVSLTGQLHYLDRVVENQYVPINVNPGVYVVELLLPSGEYIHSKLLVR